MGTVPDTVAPPAGLVTDTVGGVVSRQADVEAFIDARAEWFPAASTASTATVWVEPQARPPAVKFVLTVDPAGVPSTKTE
jgi:hypothetical protein